VEAGDKSNTGVSPDFTTCAAARSPGHASKKNFSCRAAGAVIGRDFGHMGCGGGVREAESVPDGGAPASLVVESIGITVGIRALYPGMSLCA